MKSSIFFLQIFLLIFSCNNQRSETMPSDEELIQNFKVNRAIFDELLEKFQNNLSVENIFIKDNSEYSESMSKLGLIHLSKKGFNVSYPDVAFCVYSSGFAGGGSEKGYFYAKENKNREFLEKNLLVNNLDSYYKKNSDFFVYRKLDGLWYLYCWHDG